MTRAQALRVLSAAFLARDKLQEATETRWRAQELVAEQPESPMAARLEQYAISRMRGAETTYEIANERCQRALARVLGVDPDLGLDDLQPLLEASLVGLSS